MEYEWDNKAVINLSKHGVSFEEAKTVFDDPLYVDFYDPDHSHSEHRFILLGESIQSRLLFVSYMERDNVIRIISAREKQRNRSEKLMNKNEIEDELRPEYDLQSLQVRKLGAGRKRFCDTVRLDPNVIATLPSAEAVNEALRYCVK
jgi:hypothetical protein